ncbi:MAG: hypothetical protein ACO22W_12440, partial [Steroidobacteraceae bacterium]
AASIAGPWTWQAASAGAPVALWTADPSVGDVVAGRVRRVRVPDWPRAGGSFDLRVDLAPSEVPVRLEVADASGTIVGICRLSIDITNRG